MGDNRRQGQECDEKVRSQVSKMSGDSATSSRTKFRLFKPLTSVNSRVKYIVTHFGSWKRYQEVGRVATANFMVLLFSVRRRSAKPMKTQLSGRLGQINASVFHQQPFCVRLLVKLLSSQVAIFCHLRWRNTCLPLRDDLDQPRRTALGSLTTHRRDCTRIVGNSSDVQVPGPGTSRWYQGQYRLSLPSQPSSRDLSQLASLTLSPTANMLSLAFYGFLAFGMSLTTSAAASDSGYVGYNLTLEGDEDSVIYSTDNTRQNASVTYPDPDVFLNASLSVETIEIEVDNLTAKVNLDLQVLELLQFNAGVDLSIERVHLLIQDVKAKVLLEARLENLVQMVDDVLGSLDLNPIIATLGQGVGDIVGETTDAVGGLLGDDESGSNSNSSSSSSVKRSFAIDDNILFTVNDFSGNSHTNRILEQNGDIIEQDLDNDGRVSRTKVVGSYARDMTFTGHEDTLTRGDKVVQKKQYKYEPIHGVQAVAAIFFDAAGKVVGTQILSELEVGGHATVEADS